MPWHFADAEKHNYKTVISDLRYPTSKSWILQYLVIFLSSMMKGVNIAN